jgi:FkbM family methyltransferase
MKTFLKRVALRMLPEPALNTIKRRRYARQLRALSEVVAPEDAPELRVMKREFTVLKQLVSPGDHVADIGANIGIYTKFFSGLVGDRGQVYSVEPVPLTFGFLCSSIHTLKLRNAQPMNYAISDADGQVTMEIPPYESGVENYYYAKIVDQPAHRAFQHVTVEARTLNSLFARLPHRVMLVKCDVFDNELRCVQGANQLIEASQPAWLIQSTDDPDRTGSRTFTLFDWMTRRGYGVYVLDAATLHRRQPGERSVNYFFLTNENLQTLQQRGFPSLRRD